MASGGFRTEVRLLNVADPASTCGRAYWQCLRLQAGSWKRETSGVRSFELNWKALRQVMRHVNAGGIPLRIQAQRAWQDLEDSVGLHGCRGAMAIAFLADHNVTELPNTANAARNCAIFYMKLGEKLSMAAGEWLTYVVPAASIAVAILAVAVEAKWAQSGQHLPLPTDEDGDFLKGARLQVAKARTEGKVLKLAFRALEVVVNGCFFGGMAMIVVWWPFWLAILSAVYVLPAACQYGLLQVVQVPALAIATPENRSWLSLLRSFLLVGLVAVVDIESESLRSLRNPLLPFLNITITNPLMSDIESTVGKVWPSRTLSGDIAALPLLPKQYAAQAESLRWGSAQDISFHVLRLQGVCLLVYIMALQADCVRWACVGKVTATRYRNESGLARQLASDGFQAVQHKLPKLTKVQWEPQHCLDMDALKRKVWIMALDVLFDMNTILSLLVSRTACRMLWRYDSSISLSCCPTGTFSSQRA